MLERVFVSIKNLPLELHRKEGALKDNEFDWNSDPKL